MEWIVLIIIVWVIWRLLTVKTRRAHEIQGAISRAYVANKNDTDGWINTPIYWEAAVKYAKEKGIDLHKRDDEDKSFHIDTSIKGEEISVIFMRNPRDGTTMVMRW